MSYQEEARKLLLEFLDNLDKAEKQEFLLLSSKWTVIEKSLEEKILALASKETLTPNQLYQSDLYKEFLVEAKKQVTQFAKEAGEIVAENQLRFAQAGLAVTQSELSLLKIKFNSLPIQVIKNFIGKSKEGTPLFELLKASYPETVTQLTDTLLRGIALGYNPEKTARLMAEDMSGNLTRAFRIARTEQMNVFRQTSTMQMQEAGLKEWEWLAEEDACEDCASQNGKRFPLDEAMDTHPNCRCATLPVI